MRLALTYDNFIETGLYHSPSSSTPTGFTEFAINGNVSLTPSSVTFPLGGSYSFVVVPSSGNYWKSQYDKSGNQRSWTTLDGTPALVANRGLSESEVARFHGQNGKGSYTQLKFRASGGGWYLWGSLGCDPNVYNISDWDAFKTSNSSWYMQAGAPPSGDC